MLRSRFDCLFLAARTREVSLLIPPTRGIKLRGLRQNKRLRRKPRGLLSEKGFAPVRFCAPLFWGTQIFVLAQKGELKKRVYQNKAAFEGVLV